MQGRAKGRVLVVGPAWVGDMIMAQALFMTLKQQDPDCSIDVLAPEWTLPLLSRMPEVRRGIALPVGHGLFGWTTRKAIGHELRGAYDQAIVLPMTWKSALVPWFARIPVRIGYRGEMRYGLLTALRSLDKVRLPSMIARYVALGLSPGQRVLRTLASPLTANESSVAIESTAAPNSGSETLGRTLDADRSEKQSGETFVIPRPRFQAEDPAASLQRLNLKRPDRLLALCPGAEYGPAKRWPTEHFAQLARRWIARHPKGDIWIFGSGKDRGIAALIVAQARGQGVPERRLRNLAGSTSLVEAIDLLALADAVVSNDSGLMHLAAALDRPLVALFGSSTPDYTPPNGNSAKTEILSLRLACSPCFKRECPLGHLDCLQRLWPEQVDQALMRLEPAP